MGMYVTQVFLLPLGGRTVVRGSQRMCLVCEGSISFSHARYARSVYSNLSYSLILRILRRYSGVSGSGRSGPDGPVSFVGNWRNFSK